MLKYLKYIILTLILIIFCFILYKYNCYTLIRLKGESSISIYLNQDYNDLGIETFECHFFKCVNVNGAPGMSSDVDTTNVGTYTVTYRYKDKELTRIVEVIEGGTLEVFSNSDIIDYCDNNDYTIFLDDYIASKNYHVSLLYYNLENGYTYTYNPDESYYGASLIKTLTALYVYENMEVTDELRNKVEPMISLSRNNPNIELIKKIGFAKIRAYGKSLGATEVLTSGNNEYFGTTNVYDQLAYLKHLWEFVNTNSLGNELKSYFINDKSNYIKFQDDITVMHKYGYTLEWFHDVGIVLDEAPYIVVILTKEGNNDFGSIVTDLSEKIYNLHTLVKK